MHSSFDTFEAKGRRQKLVDSLRKKGINSEEVLDAINRVPRHVFMDNAFLHHAYQDKAFPISSGQTISQPYTVAFQTQLLGLAKRDKVLEVGTGSGYQAAVLMEMGVKVFSIERHRSLFQKASKLLAQLGYDCHCFFGDGYAGKPNYGPYDGILITAAAPEVPELLMKQLKIGGRLVVPVGGRDTQVMKLIVRKGEDDFDTSDHGLFSFVPLLSGVINGKK
ncbi:MAG: protein-L-isoaspartate(D-aspartate) O-methyltransferase [Marinilabiliaceae bacterium]|jgi:protein-L-isoaspartate(D-aspartate) O-methyltransferase|nr:protein-L-isoaspartate(D-aspartate) O-methyltransferase [Marinilabiliaceae bacterium]